MMPTTHVQTQDEWQMAAQMIIDNLPADRKGIPMHFRISNHLGEEFLHMRTGEIAHSAVTNIWIATFSDTFTIHNSNLDDEGKPAKYHITVGYNTDFGGAL